MQNKDLLNLKCDNMFANAIGNEHGLKENVPDQYASSISTYTQKIEGRRGMDIGFMELPYKDHTKIQKKAKEIRSWCKNFVVLGIGGSALGNITLRDALLHSFHNDIGENRGEIPRIFIVDNIDPVRIGELEDVLGPELEKTAFNVITKSGSTAETMSQFLHFRELLDRTKGCDPARQMVLTTDQDPQKSSLRKIGNRDGYFMLPIPENVGGRFSVLSPVGLLTAAVGGMDIEGLSEGAAKMDRRCRKKDIHKNPAALYATLMFESYEGGKHISVLMPYSHKLRSLALWYCQLWAESLGKKDGLNKKNVFRGPTPVPSVGVTDQHSVMQLFQDGPFDKVITFIEVDKPGDDGVTITENGKKVEEELKYLSEKEFKELFKSELSATRSALKDKNRPNCTLQIPAVNPQSLGALFMFFEYAVTYSGYLYQVNPFDQPGVELGKKYTYGLMGREGYEPPQS